MDPMKPVEEERTIKYTPWDICDNTYQNCFPCRSDSAVMKSRRVTGRDGDSHKEYIIVCTYCGQSSGIHLSKNLTLFDWKGLQESYTK